MDNETPLYRILQRSQDLARSKEELATKVSWPLVFIKVFAAISGVINSFAAKTYHKCKLSSAGLRCMTLHAFGIELRKRLAERENYEVIDVLWRNICALVTGGYA